MGFTHRHARLGSLIGIVAMTVPLTGFGAAPAASAQAWPIKPVRLVVPFVPGGGTDIVARQIAQRLAEEFGQQFVVDNRAGAGGTIGAEIVARAVPDGYTLSFVSTSYAANPALYKLPYDPVKGIAPIARIAAGPLVLSVHPSVKAGTLRELLELLRAKPGVLNFASTGTGGFTHLATELYRQMTKTDMQHVPYKGTGAAMGDLLGGQVQLMFAAAPAAIPQIKAGKLRALGVTTEKRALALPDVPAIGETVPGYEAELWYALWAPAGTPREIIGRLNEAVGRILKIPEVIERLRADGVEPAHTTPEEIARIIARDVEKWTRVVRAGAIKVD
jgi:tripartite-type tricarboxylate transporter receptor subunit TctC